MILSFDQAGEILDDLYETFPDALFDGLNGGVSLLPDLKTDPQLPGRTMYLMGAYCHDMMGRYIQLYYGSFAALAREENWTRADWERELYQTLSHELTHHVEGLAGLRGLEIKDEEQIAQWKAEDGPEAE